jgi:hypothetical protein
MASPLYFERFVAKQGAIIKVELSIIHPDVSEFGTDRLFAWKLLYDWVSPSDDSEDSGDDVAMASRYVKSVKRSPVKNAKIKHRAKDYFTVTRTSDKDPQVVYTIEVTHAALLDGIKVGDGDELYDYVEPGKGKALTKPPQDDKPNSAKQRKGKTSESAPTPRTYDDLRRMALEGIQRCGGTWSDYLIEQGIVQKWAKDASEDRVKSWLAFLNPSFRVQGAAFVGIDRFVANKIDSAKELLQYAESQYVAKDDYNFAASSGLAALWWRLGQKQKADGMFQRVRDSMTQHQYHQNQMIHTLLSIAAQGGQWDLVQQLIPQSLSDGDYLASRLVPGAMAAFEEQESVFAALLDRWTAAVGDGTHHKDRELSESLLRRSIARGEPEQYLSLMIRWPKIIEDCEYGFIALMKTEQKSPKLALSLAETLLHHDDWHPSLHQQSFAVLSRHARRRAEEYVESQLPQWQEGGYGLPYLAAMGMETELRQIMVKALRVDHYCIAQHTPHRALAIESLKAAQAESSDPNPAFLVSLVDLGERAWVDQQLERKLAAIAQLPTKNRDLRCRYFASAAAQVGRPDLGFAAIRLPGPAVRRYAASDMVRGAAAVGDFTTAYAALQLVPEGDANGRVSTAIQCAVRAADSRDLDGPRALPLAVLDETYVRGLIAAHATDALRWMRSAHGDRLPPSIREEIDSYVRNADLATSDQAARTLAPRMSTRS